METNELTEKYAKELEIDTQVDATNLLEKQYSAPNMRHKWLYRRTQAKQHLLRLFDAKDALLHQKMQVNVLPVSIPALKKKAEGDLDIRQINRQIQDQEILVEYLDDAVKQLNQIGFDFRNLVEMMKMETL